MHQIERPAKTARVTIHTARPGVVIGRRRRHREAAPEGQQDDGRAGSHQHRRSAQAGLDAQLVAESIAQRWSAASCSVAP
ncbi:MAG: hypothetical protein R3F22_06385 [Lysobacteraceae bacterium]